MIHKFVELKSLKTIDKGPGEIEGHRAIFSVLDEGGDIILPGAFKDTIEEYLSSGFSAESHLWDFSKAIGFPVEAREDSIGFFVRSRFHSTPDAQAVRTKARERMEAGKRVGFSFGYSADDYELVHSADYKTRLPRYLRLDRLSADLAKASRFSQIRLLKRVSMIEDSLVTAPMNKLAAATGVKGSRSRSQRESGDAEVWRLRRESWRLRAKALETLYGPLPSDLRVESERIRRRAEATLAKVDTVLGRGWRSRYR